MRFTRTLQLGMSGPDVRLMKECLFRLGCYDSSFTRIRNAHFRVETVDAVHRFCRRFLPATPFCPNEIDRALFLAILRENAKHLHIALPKQLASPILRRKIRTALLTTDNLRRSLALLALSYTEACPSVSHTLCLYGANPLQQSDTATISALAACINARPKRYSKRQIKALTALLHFKKDLHLLPCGVDALLYLWKRSSLLPKDFSACGFSLLLDYCQKVPFCRLEPGDVVWGFSGLGLYLGGGYVWSCPSLDCGCRISSLTKPRAVWFTDQKEHPMFPWMLAFRPVFYLVTGSGWQSPD